MKLAKSTTILLNVVLALLVLILMKSVMTFPKSVYAGSGSTYKICYLGLSSSSIQDIERVLNSYAQDGWRLHSMRDGWTAILERAK